MLAAPMMMQDHSTLANGDEIQHMLDRALQKPLFPYSRSNTSTRQRIHEPEILSASQYPQGLVQDYVIDNANGKRKSSQQFYGGLVLSDSSKDLGRSPSTDLALEASLDKEASRPRKRSKKNANHDEESYSTLQDKKQRGRPRLDTQDETAADRRRTQIRLAQRAYRHRKESTISGLKNRVTDLQSTIEQLSRTFLQLRDNIEDSGVLNARGNKVLAGQLKVAVDEFNSLAKINFDTESEDEAVKIAELTKTDKESKSQKSKPGKSNDSRMASVLSNSSNASSSSEIGDDDISIIRSQDGQLLDTKADFQPVQSIATEKFIEESSLFNKDNVNQIDLWPVPPITDYMQYNLTEMPSPILPFAKSPKIISQIERPLRNPEQAQGFYTYSFQETTFARRIHRMCLERAYRILSNPTIDPAYAERTFRFTFCFTNRNRMIPRFHEILKRKAGESLENFNVPFVPVGGAGTHFPRRDAEGRPIYPPNMVDPARLIFAGPQILSFDVETPMGEKSIPQILEAIGYGGEWYDSHDVDEYLKTIGIHLDGHSSFVDVDPRAAAATMLMSSLTSGTPLPLLNPSESGISSASRSPLTLRTPSPSPGTIITRINQNPSNIDKEDEWMVSNPYPQSAFPEINTNMNMDMDMDIGIFSQLNDSINDKSGIIQQHSIFTQPISPSSNNTTTATTAAMLTFDVETFLQRLTDDARCLGRAPGFRKEKIDEAVRWSLSFGF